MTNERELQAAVLRGLRSCGFPNPGRYFAIQTGRVMVNETPALIVRLRLHELRVSVKNQAQTMSPTAEIARYNPDDLQPYELLQWAEEIAAVDGLAVLYAEIVRCRTCKGTGQRVIADLLMPGRPRSVRCEPCDGVGRGGPDSLDWPKEWPTLEPTGETVRLTPGSA